ncbi:MAG: dihydrodipicolinate synthase family protein [Clostridiales bacterium]|nr:dihydrodipicolinate synthase family protein [Clostridiales bacterium]
MLKEGFYCALGTPLDRDGNIVRDSLKGHIESQIEAGASGLLLMGTMGMLGCIKTDQYQVAVETAVEAVHNRVPLLVGAADNSISRVKDRLDILNQYNVSVVLTAPYYFGMTQQTAMNYFKAAASLTDHSVYLYDHPFTARYKLTYQDVLELAAVGNINGIKTGDTVLIKSLHDTTELKENFTPIFSNSDLFAVGHAYGIKHILDGIFACFPRTIKAAQEAFDKGDFEAGKAALNQMMKARDDMFVVGIWPAFSYAMNLLGFKGSFCPDYEPELTETEKSLIKSILEESKEI